MDCNSIVLISMWQSHFEYILMMMMKTMTALSENYEDGNKTRLGQPEVEMLTNTLFNLANKIWCSGKYVDEFILSAV